MHHAPNIPIILNCTKCDLINDPDWVKQLIDRGCGQRNEIKYKKRYDACIKYLDLVAERYDLGHWFLEEMKP